jgi:hypothetical protein
MKRLFNSLEPIVHRNSVTWTGPIQPHETALSYDIEIRYGLGSTPRTWVISPRLIPNKSGEIPHLYADGSLCLHLPSEWNPRELIAITVVPWVSDWLVHYEVWRATETWVGGGVHPRRSRGKTKQ